MERKIEQIKITKYERRKIKLIGWISLFAISSLIWLGSCERDVPEEKATKTKGTEKFLLKTSSEDDREIQEFKYKGHDYIGFPSRTFRGYYTLSIVHSPDCTNEKCINLNK